MRNYFKKFFSSKLSAGFTLIELLIVIAILGILATAVLSAINPVEQINRGRDTGTQSDAEQLLSAVQRFNASNGYFPWQTGATDTSNLGTGWTKVVNNAVSPDGWTIDNAASAAHVVGAWVPGNNVLDLLGSTVTDSQKELQQAFTARITATTYNALYVYNNGATGASTYVCFKPQSNQFLTVAQKRCAATPPADFPAIACDGVTPANDYNCLP